MISNEDNLKIGEESPLREQDTASKEIKLRDLLSAMWKGKWIILVTTFVFAVFSVYFALRMPDVYKSEALLVPVSESSGLKIPGQLGGLAALAGVNLGSSDTDKTGVALELLKSREFIGRFIQKHDLFIPVMAAEGWNRADDTLKIDEDVYDIRSKEWVRDVKPPFLPKPTVLEVHEEFMKLFKVSKDKVTGMVKVSVEYYSPILAKYWVDELVKSINDEMRKRDLVEAESSIDYLTKQIEKTNIADVRTMLYSLIEEQTKTVMLANVREEYLFKTLDPAVLAEKKVKPSRALIVIVAIVFGYILSVLFVLIRNFNRR